MEVCSLYRYERGNDSLVLVATCGLDPDSIETVRMGVGRGPDRFRRTEAGAGDGGRCARPSRATSTFRRPAKSATTLFSVCRFSTSGRRSACSSCRPRGAAASPATRCDCSRPSPFRWAGCSPRSRLLRESGDARRKSDAAFKTRMLDAIKRLQSYERKRDQRAAGAPDRHATLRLAGGAGFRHRPRPSARSGRQPRQRSETSQRRRLDQARERALSAPRWIARSRRSSVSKRACSVPSRRSMPALFDTQRLMLRTTTYLGRSTRRIEAGIDAEPALEEVVVGLVDQLHRAGRRVHAGSRLRHQGHRSAGSAQPPRCRRAQPLLCRRGDPGVRTICRFPISS